MREWVRLYTSAWSNPKFLGISLEAHGLWAIGLAYTGGSEREGFVPVRVVERVTRYGADGDGDPAAELVSAGLWEPVEGGWMLHNYDERQADEVARKELNRIRQQRFRAARSVTRNADNALVTRDAALRPDRVEKSRTREEKRSPNGESSSRKSENDQAALAEFTKTWNGNCAPLPTLRKPPVGAVKTALVHQALAYFDGDLEQLGASVTRCAADKHYQDSGYGFEAFCRHVERWGEVPRPRVVGREDRYAAGSQALPSPLSLAFAQMDHASTDAERAAARAAIIAAQQGAGIGIRA